MRREEIAIAGFLPLQFHPHGHALCDAAPENRDEIIRELTAFLEPKFKPLNHKPDIDCRIVKDADHLRNLVSYSVKPLRIVEPYRMARQAAATESDYIDLNEEVTLALNMFSKTCLARKQTECWGSMHGKSRNFVGIRRPDRKARKKDVIAAIAKNSSQKGYSLEEFCADAFSRPVSSETTGRTSDKITNLD